MSVHYLNTLLPSIISKDVLRDEELSLAKIRDALGVVNKALNNVPINYFNDKYFN